MLASVRSRLTFANLVSLLALFVALGGSSYAAFSLPRGSVGTGQLRKNAVTSPKVKPGSLLLSDFRASQRSRLRGAQGPAGPQGVRGEQGAKGQPGEPATRLFAFVADSGTLAYGSGVKSVRRIGTGAGKGDFNRPVVGCVALANSGLAVGVGGASHNSAQFPTIIGLNNAKLVQVTVTSILGGTPTPIDDDFNLAVFC
jgi:hypothetical protein